MWEVLLGRRGVEVLIGEYLLGIDDRYVDMCFFWIVLMNVVDCCCSYIIIIGVFVFYSIIVNFLSILFFLVNLDELL